MLEDLSKFLGKGTRVQYDYFRKDFVRAEFEIKGLRLTKNVDLSEELQHFENVIQNNDANSNRLEAQQSPASPPPLEENEKNQEDIANQLHAVPEAINIQEANQTVDPNRLLKNPDQESVLISVDRIFVKFKKMTVSVLEEVHVEGLRGKIEIPKIKNSTIEGMIDALPSAPATSPTSSSSEFQPKPQQEIRKVIIFKKLFIKDANVIIHDRTTNNNVS